MDDSTTVLREAVSLMRQGKYEESLQRHRWFHDHALEYNPALAGVRLSFALAYRIELGEKYPAATRALVEVRDAKAKALTDGKGSFELFHDVGAINGYLNEEPKTVGLFKMLHKSHPELAAQCYRAAEKSLIAHREYETCISYIPDPLAKFEEIRQLRQVKLEIAAENAAIGSSEFRDYVEFGFAEQACDVIAILIGVGRRREAERVRELGLAVSARPEVRAALDEALRCEDPGP
jgi:hypothetical protein